MYVSYVKLKNWKNFRSAEWFLTRQSYVIGPNASGKSNLLDVFRFLRDICKPAGGGLQKAVQDRGGIKKLRCLHARRDTEVRIDVHFVENPEDTAPSWKYSLGFTSEGKGAQRLLVSHEEVWRHESNLLSRPETQERHDLLQLTETYLEQTRANMDFRDIAHFFSRVTYLHLVPQLLKFGDQIGGNRLEADPFGQGFLERVAQCQQRVRESRLKKISLVLSRAIPKFEELRFAKDDVTGRPHLEARYKHYRPNAGWQREDQFSDGTLRLIGILWLLLEGDSLLLVEEPELSLHSEIVAQIPHLIDRTQRIAKSRRQIIVSTHSEALLANKAIDPAGLAVLVPEGEGTIIRLPSAEEHVGLDAGLSIADVVLPQTKPEQADQLAFW